MCCENIKIKVVEFVGCPAIGASCTLANGATYSTAVPIASLPTVNPSIIIDKNANGEDAVFGVGNIILHSIVVGGTTYQGTTTIAAQEVSNNIVLMGGWGKPKGK